MEFPKVLMAFQQTKQGDFKIAEQIVNDQTEADSFLIKYTKSTVRIEARKLTITEKNQLEGAQTNIQPTEYKKSSLRDEILGTLNIYKQAVKNVPLLKYSWILIATICILALAGFFKLNNSDVFFYGVLVIGISFLGFLVSYLLKTKDKFIKGLLYVLLSCIVLVLSAIIITFATYVLFEWPTFYDRWFSKQTNSMIQNSAKIQPIADTSYVDLELYQNPIPVTLKPNGEFALTGPHDGLTVGDLKITLKYVGNSFIPVSYKMWQPGSTPRTYEYFSIILPANTAHPPANEFKNRVPNGAFGWTFYEPIQYVLTAIDFVALIGGNSLPGRADSLPYKSLLIKSKSSASNTYDLTSFKGPFKQFDENEIKFSIFSQTLFESNESQPGLKESTVIVHNFDVMKLRNILRSDIKVKENELAASIVETRDYINAIFYTKHKTKLLLLNEERNLYDFSKSANSEEEFSHRAASLGQVSQHLNVDILRSLTHETGKEIKSIQLLDKFLTSIGKQSKEITETLRNLSRVRQGYPVHTDISGNIAALDYFGISYPVKDYESAWQTLLKRYYLALNKLYLIFEEVYIKNRK